MEQQKAISMAATLANKAFSHLITTIDNTIPLITDQNPFTYNITTSTSRYTTDKFIGIMIDTGASKRFTAGYGQFLAFQRLNTNAQLNTTIQGIVNIQFGIKSTSSIRLAKVTTPIGIIKFYIVKVDTPFLLCLADIDHLQVYFNNLKNMLITPQSEVPVIHYFGHPFLLWNTSLCNYLTKSFN